MQTSTKAFTKELEERVNVDTQYGKVLQEMQLIFKLEETELVLGRMSTHLLF